MLRGAPALLIREVCRHRCRVALLRSGRSHRQRSRGAPNNAGGGRVRHRSRRSPAPLEHRAWGTPYTAPGGGSPAPFRGGLQHRSLGGLRQRFRGRFAAPAPGGGVTGIVFKAFSPSRNPVKTFTLP